MERILENRAIFRRNMIWKFQSGTKIIIGLDEFAGAGGKIHISSQLLKDLHNRGIFYWAKVIQKWEGAIPIWKSTTELLLSGELGRQWNSIITSLRAHGIFHSADMDYLIWKGYGGSSSVFFQTYIPSVTNLRI